VNACVLSLNYFALGSPKWCPPAARHGGRQSVAQAAMVRSVEARCQSMLRSALPWDCGKIRTAHEATKVVADMMTSAGAEFGGYSQEGRAETPLGDVGRSGSPARPIVARKVALPTKPPFFDPAPHLERAGASWAAEVYTRPSLGILPEQLDAPAPSDLRRCCLVRGEEGRRLADRMDSVGMLGLVRAYEVQRPGGIFGFDKKPDPATGRSRSD